MNPRKTALDPLGEGLRPGDAPTASYRGVESVDGASEGLALGTGLSYSAMDGTLGCPRLDNEPSCCAAAAAADVRMDAAPLAFDSTSNRSLDAGVLSVCRPCVPCVEEPCTCELRLCLEDAAPSPLCILSPLYSL